MNDTDVTPPRTILDDPREPKPHVKPSADSREPRKLVKADAKTLAGLYGYAGMVAMAVGREDVAEAVMGSAESCADAWLELANKNPKIRRVLLSIIEGGVWGGLVLAHLPIVYCFAPAHIRDMLASADEVEDDERA